MPTVSYQGEEIECEEGAILRDVLKEAGLSVYNGRAEQFNCRGTGSCGTCAVQVDGAVSEPGKKEKARLWLPRITRVTTCASRVRLASRATSRCERAAGSGGNTSERSLGRRTQSALVAASHPDRRRRRSSL